MTVIRNSINICSNYDMIPLKLCECHVWTYGTMHFLSLFLVCTYLLWAFCTAVAVHNIMLFLSVTNVRKNLRQKWKNPPPPSSPNINLHKLLERQIYTTAHFCSGSITISAFQEMQNYEERKWLSDETDIFPVNTYYSWKWHMHSYT
jgi:hypothetical protein